MDVHAPASFNNLTGHTLRGYDVRDLIGVGGFAAVYRAFQPMVGREVAIKVVLPQHANNPDFIRRFEYEAQIVARLEHPHIVPLYDFWREPDAAILVMRWLSGGSLAKHIEKGPIPIERITRYLDQLAPALDLAHRRGIIHRDLKSGNVLLDDDDNAYLADFGIAKDTLNPTNITEQGVMIGSPSYFSPEQVQGKEIKATADIYSLGILVFEMLTGFLPFPATTIVELIYKHVHEPLPLLSKYRPNLPDALNDVLSMATAKKPEERYPTVAAFTAAFRQAAHDAGAATTQTTQTPTDISREIATPFERTSVEKTPLWAVTTPGVPENPYKGLRAFQEEDSSDFFGRDALIQQLIYRMTEPEWGGRFLAVIGPSGSGKSSVIRAGLIPALRTGVIPGSDKWFIVDMLPSAHPYEELERALLRVSPNPLPNAAQRLRQQADGLINLVQDILPADRSELLLVVDQFEELFTLVSDEATRAAFLSMIMTAVTTAGSRLRVLVTLRADFYDKPLLYQAFGELIKKRTEVVLPLGTQELQMAIVGPAQRVGLTVVPELIEAMTHDVGEQAGALPLLQYALTELYERRQGHMLSLTTYLHSGGVMGALARRADELYAGLDTAAQAAARQLFLRLVTLGDGTEDTRRRVRATEVMSTPERNKAIDKVIDVFARYRLLTLDRDPITRGPTIEVAHEALIRSWTRLREWLSESRSELKTQRRLTQAASDWVNSNREESYLASGSRLDQFESWKAITSLNLSAEEQEYLDASLQERTRRRAAEQARRDQELRTARMAQNFQRAAVVLAVVGALAVIATVIAFWEANRSRTEVTQAQATLNQVVATLTPIPLMLTSAAERVTFGEATLASVSEQAERQQARVEALQLASAAEESLQRLGSDPQTAVLLAIRSLKLYYTPEADAVLARALAASERMRVLAGNLSGVLRAAYSQDGKVMGATTWEKELVFFDGATGAIRHRIKAHDGPVLALEFLPDGKQAVTGSIDDTVKLWNVETGEIIREVAKLPADVTALDLSPDTSIIATADPNGTARLLDFASGQERLTLNVCEKCYLTGVSFSPDGRRVVTAGADGMVRVWDVATGDKVMEINAQVGETNNPQYSPNGADILVGAMDGSLRLYDAATGRELRRMKANTDRIYSAYYSSDGDWIISGGTDRTIHIWEATSGIELVTFQGHSGHINRAVLSPDKRQVLSVGGDRSARLWKVNIPKDKRRLTGHAKEVYSAAFSPDGRMLLTGSNDLTVRLWDVATGQTLRVFAGHSSSLTSAIFSPDGQHVLSAGAEGTVRLWETATGAQIAQLDYPDGQPVYNAIFSPDLRLIVTASGDKTIRFWDAKTWQPIRVLEGHTDNVYALHFTPDAKRLMSTSRDGTARLWDVETGQEIRRFSTPDIPSYNATFSPDFKHYIVPGFDGVIRMWDVETGEIVREFKGHSGRVSGAIITPDGELLVSFGDDRTARLWRVATGEEVRKLGGVSDVMRAGAMSPDGKLIAGAVWDGTARLWNTYLSDFLAEACAASHRDFTDAERAQFKFADKEPTCPQFGTQSAPNPPTPTLAMGLVLPAWTPIAPPTRVPPPTYTPTLSPTPLPGILITFTPAPTLAPTKG